MAGEGSVRQDYRDAQIPIPGMANIATQSPIPEDLLITIDAEVSPSDYTPLPLGTEKEDNNVTGLNLRLVSQSPIIVDNQRTYVRRLYANERVHQDVYNYGIQYALESTAHPIFIRSYIVKRDKYAPLAKGSKLSGVLYCTVTNGGSNYVTPVVNFIGGGAGASAMAVTYNGRISYIIVLSEGVSYSANPTITITDAGGGTGGTATATIQPTGCILVKEEVQRLEDTQYDGYFVRVVRVYEVIPGPTVSSQEVNRALDGMVVTTENQKVAAGSAAEYPEGTIDSQVSGVDVVTSQRVTTSYDELPDVWYTYEVTQDLGVMKVRNQIYHKDALPLPDITEPGYVDSKDEPMWPFVRRRTYLMADGGSFGHLPPDYTDYDTITYTFPGIVLNWGLSFSDPNINGALDDIQNNRDPFSAPCVAKVETSFSMGPTNMQSGTQPFRVLTRAWAKFLFGFPDKTLHVGLTIPSGGSILVNGINYVGDTSVTSSPAPGTYDIGDDIIVSKTSKRYIGPIFINKITTVKAQ